MHWDKNLPRFSWVWLLDTQRDPVWVFRIDGLFVCLFVCLFACLMNSIPNSKTLGTLATAVLGYPRWSCVQHWNRPETLPSPNWGKQPTSWRAGSRHQDGYWLRGPGIVCLFIYLFVCMYVCLFVCLFVLLNKPRKLKPLGRFHSWRLSFTYDSPDFSTNIAQFVLFVCLFFCCLNKTAFDTPLRGVWLIKK